VLEYAGRAVQLAEDLFGEPYEGQLVERLRAARSNLPQFVDGAGVWKKLVAPARVDLPKLASHYAASSLFESFGARTRIYCYTVERQEHHVESAGPSRVALGRARFSADITGESAVLSYGVVHFGDHNLNGGVQTYRGEERFKAMVQEVLIAFERADLPEVIRLLDRHFEGTAYSLQMLFRDQQRRILELILTSTLGEIEEDYRRIVSRYAPLARFLGHVDMPVPRALSTAGEFVLNEDLRRAFVSADKLDEGQVEELLKEAGVWRASLDAPGLAYALEQSVERLARRWAERPEDLPLLTHLESLTGLARLLPFQVTFWKAQNVYYDLRSSAFALSLKAAADGDAVAREWVERFRSLGETLGMRADL
jgi:hypothetical protein